MTSLNRDFTILRNWFNKNVMVLNPDKRFFFFLLIGVKDKRQTDLVLTAFLLKSAKKKKNHF